MDITPGEGVPVKRPISKLKQRGQALVASIFFATVASMGLILMYNTSQAVTEKTRLVNAADAAAYSGGVYVARQLNYMAYTNRAMIANHVAVGHLVSYMSWLRYLDDATYKIAAYTRLIPKVNVATSVVARAVRNVKKGSEKVARILVKIVRRFNYLLAGSQFLSSQTLIGVISNSPILAPKVMDKVGKSYDPSIRVNYLPDIQGMSASLGGLQVVNDSRTIFQYYKRYSASNDSGRLRRMVEASYGISGPWIQGNRGWGRGFVFIKLEKQGSTQHIASPKLTDWRAQDHLDYKWWTIKGWKSKVVARGSANAREFDSGYDGITKYYDVKNLGKSARQSLNISAYATTPVSTAKLMNVMQFNTGVTRIAALSRAEIYHKRNAGNFDSMAGEEYANLYNPFWQVRLVKNSF